MTIYTISDQATLNAAIADIAGRAGTDTFNFTSDVTLTGQITALFLTAGENLTINGNGHTIDGNNTYGGFVIKNGTVAINDLDIVHTTARGGNDTGWLYYDSNGSAAGGSTHFATLAANLALTNADFVLV